MDRERILKKIEDTLKLDLPPDLMKGLIYNIVQDVVEDEVCDWRRLALALPSSDFN